MNSFSRRWASRRIPSHSITPHEPGIPRVAAGHNAVQSQALEAELEHGAPCLRRVPTTLMIRMDRISDLALSIALAHPDEDDVTDDHAGPTKPNRQLESVALELDRGPSRHLRDEVFADLVGAAHAPVGVAHHVRTRLHVQEGVEIAFRAGAQQQSLSLDGIGRLEHQLTVASVSPRLRSTCCTGASVLRAVSWRLTVGDPAQP